MERSLLSNQARREPGRSPPLRNRSRRHLRREIQHRLAAAVNHPGPLHRSVRFPRPHLLSILNRDSEPVNRLNHPLLHLRMYLPKRRKNRNTTSSWCNPAIRPCRSLRKGGTRLRTRLLKNITCPVMSYVYTGMRSEFSPRYFPVSKNSVILVSCQ